MRNLYAVNIKIKSRNEESAGRKKKYHRDNLILNNITKTEIKSKVNILIRAISPSL